MEKVILTTGGTGGHIFPALAVAEEIRRRRPGASLLFIGSAQGPEKRLAEKWDLPFVGLNVRGFLGRGLRAIPAAFGMAKAIAQAGREIRRFNPDLAAGFGGYASFAPILAAWLARKPVLIHEQNAIAGSGNRFLARLAGKICVSLPNTNGFAKKCELTGNPARAVFQNVWHKRKARKSGKRLLVLGGSQGARALNDFVCAKAVDLERAGVEIRHQAGPKNLERVKEKYKAAGVDPGKAEAFIEDMAGAYEWADLVLCRAGASTIAELCVCGAPALFVPLPSAIHDHQNLNAQRLAEAGAAEIMPESGLMEAGLAKILELLADSGRLRGMGKAARALAREDAAALIVDAMEEMARKGAAS